MGITDKVNDSLVETGTGLAARFNAVAFFHERREYNANGMPLYIGWAKVGVGTGTVGWAVSKHLYSGTRDIATVWGSGNANFDKRWTNRASYTYT